MKNSNKIEEIVKYLHTDESRINFLVSVYTPGNIEVADCILSLYPKSEKILKKEIMYAKEHGMNERLEKLGKRYADKYIIEDLDILLRDEVIEWKNENLANYVIENLISSGETDKIDYAADIAEAFGMKEKTKEYRKKVLKIKKEKAEKENDHFDSLAGAYSDMGKYSKAIDCYLKQYSKESKYYHLGSALSIAKENCKLREKEIAKKAFEEFDIGKHHCWLRAVETYLDSAEILGRTDKAKITLSDFAKKEMKKIDSPPRGYYEVVDGLLRLELKDTARNLVRAIAKHELKQNRKKDSYTLGGIDELKSLIEKVGSDSVFDEVICLAEIDYGIRDRWSSSDLLKRIEKGYQINKRPIFLKRKLVVLEREGEFTEAEKLAKEIGNEKLADAYHKMGEMKGKADEDPNDLYDGKILKTELIGKMKCYFAACKNFPLNENEIEERKKQFEDSGIADYPGFAVVWKPDVVAGKIREDSQGFKLSVYDFGTKTEIEGIKRTCYIDGKVIGFETDALLESETLEEYKTEWMQEERFRKKQGFNIQEKEVD